MAIKNDNLNNFKLRQNVTTKYSHGVEKKNSIRSYHRPNCKLPFNFENPSFLVVNL